MEEDIGLKYIKEPPKVIKGNTRCNIKTDIRFYFDTHEEKDFVYELFKDGSSRIPSGKKLLDFIKRYTGQEPEEKIQKRQAKL